MIIDEIKTIHIMEYLKDESDPDSIVYTELVINGDPVICGQITWIDDTGSQIIGALTVLDKIGHIDLTSEEIQVVQALADPEMIRKLGLEK